MQLCIGAIRTVMSARTNATTRSEQQADEIETKERTSAAAAATM